MTDTPQPVYLADYSPFPFRIDAVALTVRLHPQATRVSARLSVTPLAGQAMRLDGEGPRLLALRLPGDSDQVCALGRSGRAPQAEFDAAFNEVQAVHLLLGAYFEALGRLAADQLPLPNTALAGSLSAVKAAGVPVSSAEEAALKSLGTLLGRALDGYRQREEAAAGHDQRASAGNGQPSQSLRVGRPTR